MRAPLFNGSADGVIYGAAFTLMLAWACVSDIRTRRISNRLVGLLALTGVMYSVVASSVALRAVLVSVAGLSTGLTIWIPFYVMRWLGAGDVKFFAAVGAWLGPLRTVESALVAAIVGGVLAAVWMIQVYGVQGTAATASLALASPRRVTNHPVDRNHRRALPYGVALSVGAAVVAWFPWLLESLYGH